MHFERSLRRAIFAPWKDKYINYAKLKDLLRDEGSDAGSDAGRQDTDNKQWTDDDESAFVEELVNVQLEKVHTFQAETLTKLRDRTSACEAKLDPLLTSPTADGDDDKGKTSTGTLSEPRDLGSEAQPVLQKVIAELDSITGEMNELEKYSRINYTGFLKAAKKHDRRRGQSYRVRPLMQVRLAALPFNKEDYSPLLFRLSTMYSFVRQHLDGNDKRLSMSESQMETEEFTSEKCMYVTLVCPSETDQAIVWVHPENLLELRTVILRRLPVLIYNPQTSKVVQGGTVDPTITSIYFDNPAFSLYNNKVSHSSAASSLRLRWYGQLADNPEIYFEKKIVQEDDSSQEQRFTTKIKYVHSFLKGEYKLEKDVQKLKDRFGAESDQVKHLASTIEDMQDFVKSNGLQPVLRANYTRQAFQIPGDNRVRITLDTNLALIREDALDQERPCRDPEDWHRRDIDDGGMEFPFEKIRKGEINRFPYAILEIRTKGRKKYEWVAEVMNSHLVKPATRFSKFVHGVAQLFDDSVNTFPFWLSEVETDIRRDPHQAFEEEQERKAKVAEDEVAVGSLLKNTASPINPNRLSGVGSPKSSRRPASRKATVDMTRNARATTADKSGREITAHEDDSDADGPIASDARGFKSYLPTFSTSRYGMSKRADKVALPPGVREPSFWIKNEGPVKVEAKVWLANQRTFIKWQHVSILLASLSLGLYNAAGVDNNVARTLAIVYTILALFIAAWGWGIYMYRSKLIRERSGKDFDNVFGPLVVCVGLAAALCLNFGFKVSFILGRAGRGGRLALLLQAVLMNLLTVSSRSRCEAAGPRLGRKRVHERHWTGG